MDENEPRTKEIIMRYGTALRIVTYLKYLAYVGVIELYVWFTFDFS